MDGRWDELMAAINLVAKLETVAAETGSESDAQQEGVSKKDRWEAFLRQEAQGDRAGAVAEAKPEDRTRSDLGESPTLGGDASADHMPAFEEGSTSARAKDERESEQVLQPAAARQAAVRAVAACELAAEEAAGGGGGACGGGGGGTEEEQLGGAMDMLAVGAVLEGDIVIPGMQAPDELGADRMTYTLEVLREERDERGRWVLLGKHAAYGDEQVCPLELSPTPAGELDICFADGETHCSGRVDLATQTITGEVKQLLLGEQGFFVPSTQVSHTFRLRLKQEPPGARDVRVQLKRARQRRLKALSVLWDGVDAVCVCVCV